MSIIYFIQYLSTTGWIPKDTGISLHIGTYSTSYRHKDIAAILIFKKAV